MQTVRWTRCPRELAGAIVSLAFVAIVPHAAVAQDAAASGAILVTVRDSSGAALAGAQLSLRGTTMDGVTDDKGQLRLTSVPPGPVRLDVRRLGFHPVSLMVTVPAHDEAEATVTLAQIAQHLAPILIRGTADDYSPQMAGFYKRRNRGIGRFLTREQIASQNASDLTDVFRMLPNVQIVSTRYIAHAVRFRGQRCAPLVWLDGFPLAAAEFDLDAVRPESVEGIEVYSGISEVPAQFMGPRGLGSCGVVLLWSRQGTPRERRRAKNPVTAAQLAELVESLKVYTADEVDTPARPDTSAPAKPLYPAALFADHVNGKVTVEFVVDTTGKILMETFNAISSTNRAFTAAVRSALPAATYIPAQLHGQPVKQVVHQPFTFVTDSTKQGQQG